MTTAGEPGWHFDPRLLHRAQPAAKGKMRWRLELGTSEPKTRPKPTEPIFYTARARPRARIIVFLLIFLDYLTKLLTEV